MYYCTRKAADAVCNWLDIYNIDGGSVGEPFDPWSTTPPVPPDSVNPPSAENWAQWLVNTVHSTSSYSLLLQRIRKYGPNQAVKMTKDESEPPEGQECVAPTWPA